MPTEEQQKQEANTLLVNELTRMSQTSGQSIGDLKDRLIAILQDRPYMNRIENIVHRMRKALDVLSGELSDEIASTAKKFEIFLLDFTSVNVSAQGKKYLNALAFAAELPGDDDDPEDWKYQPALAQLKASGDRTDFFKNVEPEGHYIVPCTGKLETTDQGPKKWNIWVDGGFTPAKKIHCKDFMDGNGKRKPWKHIMEELWGKEVQIAEITSKLNTGQLTARKKSTPGSIVWMECTITQGDVRQRPGDKSYYAIFRLNDHSLDENEYGKATQGGFNVFGDFGQHRYDKESDVLAVYELTFNKSRVGGQLIGFVPTFISERVDPFVPPKDGSAPSGPKEVNKGTRDIARDMAGELKGL